MSRTESLHKAEADASDLKLFSEKFSEIDTNKDEFLTTEELAAFHKTHRGRPGRKKDKQPTVF